MSVGFGFWWVVGNLPNKLNTTVVAVLAEHHHHHLHHHHQFAEMARSRAGG